MPHLHGLHLHRPAEFNEYDGTLICDITNRLEAPWPVLYSLRNFTYEWQYPFAWVDTTILRLPHIRSIAIHQSYKPFWIIVTPAVVAAAAATSSSTHLTFTYGSASLQPLQWFLSIPRGLTHLSYLHMTVREDSRFDALGLALVTVKTTLMSLHIDFLSPEWELDSLPANTIGSFREWPALQKVRCPLLLLLGGGDGGLGGVLPMGIRELEILGSCYTPVGEAVKEVVELLAAKEMVPALETVGVCIHCRKSKRVTRSLRKACWAVGVGLLERAFV